jgi:hypothetical protein
MHCLQSKITIWTIATGSHSWRVFCGAEQIYFHATACRSLARKIRNQCTSNC